MRFLVDAQLPPALAHWLSERGHDATHVLHHGLLNASDRAIWEEAQRLGAIIISKDEDFVNFRTLTPEGPALIWVRVGNTTRRELLARFSALMPEVERQLLAGEKLIEVASRDEGGSSAGR
jgi:predicted nuclease of predicted toxin-antitoxin system